MPAHGPATGTGDASEGAAAPGTGAAPETDAPETGTPGAGASEEAAASGGAAEREDGKHEKDGTKETSAGPADQDGDST